jgi:MbtH protein
VLRTPFQVGQLPGRMVVLARSEQDTSGVPGAMIKMLDQHDERIVTMSTYESDDTTRYKVVVNHEEQYSIWPADRDNPAGWSNVGKDGSKAECLAYIKEVWTDMRPLSLRKWMEDSSRPTEA